MDRRAFVAVMGGSLLASAFAAEAEQSSKPARVGVLIGGISPAAVRESPYIRAFRDALVQLGYREGQNLLLEVRSAERQTALAGPAQELVQLKVDVIVAGGVASARSAKAATQTIPIVGVGVGGDPVAMGLAQSIAHPGGNFTGFLHGGTEIGKLLQLLQEALPGLTQTGAVWNSDNPIVKENLDRWDAEARARGLSLRLIRATSVEELDAAFTTLAAEKIRAAFVAADPVWVVHNRRAAEIGLRHRIAAIWGHLEIAQAGGLMAYAPDINDLFRQAAGYVKKILDGAKPGDLPLQYPNRWTLVVNLKTAKTIASRCRRLPSLGRTRSSSDHERGAHPRSMKIGYHPASRRPGDVAATWYRESGIECDAGAFGTPHCCCRARRAESSNEGSYGRR